MGIEFNDDAIRGMFEDIGNRVRDIVNQTVRETQGDDIETATDKLHQRLNDVDGLEFPRSWSRNAVETLRRGEELQIKIG